jgi:hypothetical protein
MYPSPFTFEADPIPEPNEANETAHIEHLSALYWGEVGLAGRAKFENGDFLKFFLLPDELGLVVQSGTLGKASYKIATLKKSMVPAAARVPDFFQTGIKQLDGLPPMTELAYIDLPVATQLLSDPKVLPYGAHSEALAELTELASRLPGEEFDGKVMRRVVVAMHAENASRVTEGDVFRSRVKIHRRGATPTEGLVGGF